MSFTGCLKALAGAALCGMLVLAAPAATAADKIVMGLDWQVLGRHAGFFVAKQEGDYQRAGLDVDIQRGYGGADAIKRVAAGDSTFGFGDVGSLVLARSQGVPVTAVAIIYARGPYVLWTRKASHIEKPKDLEGKTIGSPAGSAVRVLFPAFAQKAGVDADKVKWATVDASALYPLIFSGRADAIVDYVLGWPTVSAKAKEAGVELGALKYADYGLDIYSNAIVVADKTLKEKPDLVRRFLAATLKGLHATFGDPQRAAKIVTGLFPVLDRKTAPAEIEIVRSLAETDEAKQHGLGYMSQQKMARTRDIIAAAYKIKDEVPVQSLYTNAFLPKGGKGE